MGTHVCADQECLRLILKIDGWTYPVVEKFRLTQGVINQDRNQDRNIKMVTHLYAYWDGSNLCPSQT